MPRRYYWHFVLPRSIRSLARFFPITSRSPATTRSYMCYSDSTQRVSERAVTLPVPVLPIAGLLIRRGIPPGRQVYIRSSRWLHTHTYTHTYTYAGASQWNSNRSRAYLFCAWNWLHFMLSILFPSHPTFKSVYIRYLIVLPCVIVARDINSDIRQGTCKYVAS